MAAVQMACRSLSFSLMGEGCTRAVGFLWGGHGPPVVLALRWEEDSHKTGKSLTSFGWHGLYLGGRSLLGLGEGPSSRRTRDKLGWHGPGKASQWIESREEYSSPGMQVNLFWLVWPGPFGEVFCGWGRA